MARFRSAGLVALGLVLASNLTHVPYAGSLAPPEPPPIEASWGISSGAPIAPSNHAVTSWSLTRATTSPTRVPTRGTLTLTRPGDLTSPNLNWLLHEQPERVSLRLNGGRIEVFFRNVHVISAETDGSSNPRTETLTLKYETFEFISRGESICWDLVAAEECR